MPRFQLNEERENLFSLYQVVHPEVLSKIVGSRVFGLEQEVPLGGMKVDICGWAEGSNQNIYGEIQLIPADARHKEKIMKILTDIARGIVVWQALSFEKREHLIEEVKDFAKGLKRPIDILFVEINPNLFPFLENLKLFYSLDVISNLSLLSEVNEPFKKIAEYRGRDLFGEEEQDGTLEAVNGSQGQVVHEPLQHEPKSLSTRLGANIYILEEIRKKMAYYPGAYRAKSRLDTNAITFGAGNGNTFEISIRDNYSHVKLRIQKKNISTWMHVKMDKLIIENRIEYRINFKEERTSYIVDVPILSSAKRPRIEVLDEMVQVFKVFVEFFTKYFYEMEPERKVVGAR